MRRYDLPRVTLDLRHAGELLAHPCRCGKKNCTLGTHIWSSTEDMAPGAKATNTDPRSRSWPTESDDSNDPPADTTLDLHAEYRRRITAAQQASRDLARFIDSYRPDRVLPLKDQPADNSEDWCRNCLRHGFCNPRHRGDSCRSCYDFALAYPDLERPRELIQAKHEGRRITQPMVDEAVARARQARRNKRRKRAAA